VNLRELKRKEKQIKKMKIMEEIDEENAARALRDAREDEDDTDKREERKEEKKLVYIDESSSSESSSDLDNEQEIRNRGIQNQTGIEEQEVKRKTSVVSNSIEDSNIDDEAILETLDKN
jgi:hypothetical protein